MGIWFSCPGSDYFDECLDGEIESAATEAPAPATVRRSISFKTLTGEDVDTIIRTISFGRSGRRVGECTKLKSLGSGEIIIQGSLSFKSATKTDDEFHLQTTLQKQDLLRTATTTRKETADMQDSVPVEDDPKHEAAAVKLQKVYKSFRTRRQLADCAVLVEQSWWKLLDFALLKHSSYFDAKKPESVGSRWSRARTKAAKVGKGLSKNTKAQKLALQHWLEAIDPRHRYGHNLHLYYVRWLHCESKQPFFYWLDVGEGKEENIERCPRLKLQQQCIKYLGPKERETYQVIVEDGRLIYKKNQQLVDTYGDNKDSKWIFVLSASKILYAAKKKKGKFQHSSFLAGGATSSAGRLVVEQGILKAVWPHSGHYRPTEENFQEFLRFLKENNVDLTDVKISPIDEDIEGTQSQSTRTTSFTITEPLRDASSDYSFHKRNLFEEVVEVRDDKEDEEDGNNKNEEPIVSRELILKRINSKKGTKSLQLGKQLSIKWTTGAGPRISCVRDFPSELQFRALEQVNLSPRSEGSCRSGTPRFSSTLHGD